MILPCDCKNTFQDREYGKGQRVHNEMATKMSGQREARCSVCLKTKSLKSASGKVMLDKTQQGSK